MDSAGDLDRISALPDKLLHRILASVGEATAVTRTAALSRRWRRVWVHAQHLALWDTTVRRGAGGFEVFVDWVLAQRGDADIGSLEIGMYRHDRWASPRRVNGWLRYAMRRVVNSFSLSLRSMRPPRGADGLAVLLPGHGRMASVSLYLSEHHRFQLPVAAAARYEALTELRLFGASFDEAAAPGGGCTLGDFVSSCFPRLRKLDISSPSGLPQLVIRSETLEELRLCLAEDLRVLDVTAPNMRVLKLNLCFPYPVGFDSDDDEQVINVARIVAPRLEEIAMHNFANRRRPDLDIHDTASVRRLIDFHLDMHGPYCRDEDGSFWLLENCPGVEHIDVSVDHWGGCADTDRDLVDLTAEGAAPFANVRSMVVKAHNLSESHLVSSISSLLSRCPHLRSLALDTTGTGQTHWSWKCFCDEVDTWRFHRKFSLGSLEEVTIRGFAGAEEDMELLTLLFESSDSIRSVTLHAITWFPGYVSLERMMAEDENDTQSIVQKLKNIPYTDRGHWHFGKDAATWTSYATEKAIGRGDANSA